VLAVEYTSDDSLQKSEEFYYEMQSWRNESGKERKLEARIELCEGDDLHPCDRNVFKIFRQ
jgi:hypothetical protein